MKLPFDYRQAIYRKNNFNNPCVWYCHPITNNNIEVIHGRLDGKLTTDTFYTTRDVNAEVSSRYAAKRKTGYKFISEIRDDTTSPVEESSLLTWLMTYLPNNRTTADNNLLPMLAKVYDNTNNKLFKKVSSYLGQWKINGLRCFVRAKVNPSDMFHPISLEFQSREGTIWTSLIYLEEFLLSVIHKDFINKMIEENIVLDGELYLPGHSVNEINHFVKDSNCKENHLLQYWCYDLAVEDMIQDNRFKLLYNNFDASVHVFNNKENHLNNTDRLVVLPCIDITSGDDAMYVRNRFIDFGFEGLILRNPNSTYQYGKRNNTMIKYKRATDGLFRVIDIYPEGTKRKDIPLLKCKNDINDAVFEVHVNGSFEYQRSILKNKEKYIGNNLYIEYGERSGVDQVPFHVKTVIFK